MSVEPTQPLRPSRRRRVIQAVLALVLLVFLGLQAWIFGYGTQSDLVPCDCILILGTRSLADGTPGPNLKTRCDWALKLYREGWSKNVICTGGLGADGTVESVVSKNYLIRQGLPADSIYTEEKSHNTRENMRYASVIFRQKQWRSCLVVTDPFHQYRSIQLARQFQIEGHRAPNFGSPAWTQWNKFLYYQLRESASLVKFMLESEEGGPANGT